jgi:hypothetical protein
MMPHHLNMVRSQCRVEASFGGGVAGLLATIRLSPQQGKQSILKTRLVEDLGELASRPGLSGGHLLITDTPQTIAPTTEQQIRGADGAADWIVLVSGYDPEVLQRVVSDRFSSPALHLAGAHEKSVVGLHRLAFTMTSADVAAIKTCPA